MAQYRELNGMKPLEMFLVEQMAVFDRWPAQYWRLPAEISEACEISKIDLRVLLHRPYVGDFSDDEYVEVPNNGKIVDHLPCDRDI